MGCRWFFFFQAEDGIRDLVRSRGLGDVYKRQTFAARSVEDILSSLYERETLKYDNLRDIDYQSATLRTRLFEIQRWRLGLNPQMERVRFQVEQELASLEGEKRKEHVECWRDVTRLKGDLRDALRARGDAGASSKIDEWWSYCATNDRSRTSTSMTMTAAVAWVSDDHARTIGDPRADDPGLRDIRKLITEGQTLHLIGDVTDGGSRFAPLVGALTAEVAHVARRVATESGGRLDPPLTMVLDEAGISITPGTAFGQQGEGYVRISLGADTDRIREGLERLKKLDLRAPVNA